MRALSLLAAAVLLASAAEAHHSIAGIYDAAREVRLDGAVVEFRFVNPHPFVDLAVTDASGRTQQWRLELDNRRELVAAGMTAETLRPGDRLAITGSAARDGSRALYVRTLDRPADGFRYEQVGSSPRVRRGIR